MSKIKRERREQHASMKDKVIYKGASSPAFDTSKDDPSDRQAPADLAEPVVERSERQYLVNGYQPKRSITLTQNNPNG